MKNVYMVCVMGVLAALSIVLVMFNTMIFTAVPFLKYDLADIPVLITGLILGPVYGLAVLAVASFVQAFFLGGDGWVGLVMHFCASGVLVLASSLIYRKWRSIPSLITGLITGTICMTVLMIPLNYIFTVNFFGIPVETLNKLLIWVILFNLVKASLNSVISGTVFKILDKALPNNFI